MRGRRKEERKRGGQRLGEWKGLGREREREREKEKERVDSKREA